MEKTEKPINYLEILWVLTVRKKLKTLKAEVCIENIWRPEKQWEDDIGIMDAMVMVPGVNANQLKEVNMFSVYLQVIMLSEIANVQGSAIPHVRMTGQWGRESSLTWPELPQPPPKVWEVFR